MGFFFAVFGSVYGMCNVGFVFKRGNYLNKLKVKRHKEQNKCWDASGNSLIWVSNRQISLSTSTGSYYGTASKTVKQASVRIHTPLTHTYTQRDRGKGKEMEQFGATVSSLH